MLGLSQHYLGWVGRGAEDAANFRHQLDGVEHIDWIKPLAQKEDETVSSRDCQGVFLRQFDHRRVGSAPTDQALPGRLAKRQTEFDPWHAGHQGLVKVLDGFNEVTLAKDKVDRLRFFDFNGDQVHGGFLLSRIVTSIYLRV